MGNICDAIGITRREPVKIENKNANSPSSSETKSPVVGAASPSSSATHTNASHTMNTVEMKVALAKKQSDHAAAAAAIEILTGPRIRLLPHQHTLFCERKQRVCSAVGEQQEMEVLVLEGLHAPTPSFSWIRISDLETFNAAVVNGTVGPSNYIVLEQEHALNERGVPAHSMFEYVLTREDVGHYIGVRYEDGSIAVGRGTQKVTKVTSPSADVSDEKKQVAVPAAGQSGDDMAVRHTMDSMVDQVERDSASNTAELAADVATDTTEPSLAAADSQALPSPPPHSEAQSEESKVALEQEHAVEVQSLYKYLTLVSHGPVKPGPPRLTEFNISGSMQVGTIAVAEASYIGGYEGATEYWWMRISPEGKRTQVTEPCRVPYPARETPLQSAAVLPVSSTVPAAAATTPTVAAIAADGDSGSGVAVEGGEVKEGEVLKMDPPPVESGAESTVAAQMGAIVDPRYYLLTADDVGCSLKVKCRPTRSDGVEGEIFTSTSSEEVTSA